MPKIDLFAARPLKYSGAVGAAEFLLLLFAWGIPLALAVFVVSSLWQINRSMGSIEREVSEVRRLLERGRAGS